MSKKDFKELLKNEEFREKVIEIILEYNRLNNETFNHSCPSFFIDNDNRLIHVDMDYTDYSKIKLIADAYEKIKNNNGGDDNE